MEFSVPIEISARHVHLTAQTLAQLFGAGATLRIKRPLSQTGQFAAEETVTLRGPKGELQHVRIVGPVRKYNQVELSQTDARILGNNPPLRESGEVEGSAPIIVIGPQGEARLAAGEILQERHLHASPADAERLGIKDQQSVECRVDGPRGALLKQVRVRVDPSFLLRVHLDTDEAAAVGISNGQIGTVIV